MAYYELDLTDEGESPRKLGLIEAESDSAAIRALIAADASLSGRISLAAPRGGFPSVESARSDAAEYNRAYRDQQQRQGSIPSDRALRREDLSVLSIDEVVRIASD